MGAYNLPRNVKGEGRILFIFTKKSMIYTAIAGVIGVGLAFLLSTLGMTVVGIVLLVICALIGFSICTFKVPDLKNISWARVNAGENIDAVIMRAIKFKHKGNKVYIYKEEETDDK